MYVSFYCMFPLFLIVSCIFFTILHYVYDFIINKVYQKSHNVATYTQKRWRCENERERNAAGSANKRRIVVSEDLQ